MRADARRLFEFYAKRGNIMNARSRRAKVGFVVAAMLAGCSGGGDPPTAVAPAAPVVAAPPVAAPTAAPTAAAAPAAEPAPLTFEQKIAASQPLTPTTASVPFGAAPVTAVRCTMAGLPDNHMLDDSGMDVIGRMEMTTDGKLYIVDKEGQLMRFDVSGDETTCTLALDATFGTNGRLNPGQEIEELAAVAGNTLYAANGIFDSYRLVDGVVNATCNAGRGYVAASADGRNIMAHFVNGTMRRPTYTAAGCTSEDVAIPAPFASVNTAAFVGRNFLIGGVMSEPVGNWTPRIVVAYDPRTMREAFRFGATEGNSGADDAFGWVHAIEPCGANICALDSNYRKLTVWSARGVFIGKIPLSTLFGLEYPWITDVEVTTGRGATAFMTVSQQRQRSGVYEGMVYRVSGLN